MRLDCDKYCKGKHKQGGNQAKEDKSYVVHLSIGAALTFLVVCALAHDFLFAPPLKSHWF